jgi:hypothetical protein
MKPTSGNKAPDPNNVTVPPNQSIPGPFANYDTVTINPGGQLTSYQQTNVTIQTLLKKS